MDVRAQRRLAHTTHALHASPPASPPQPLPAAKVKVKVNAFTWVLTSFSPHSYLCEAGARS